MVLKYDHSSHLRLKNLNVVGWESQIAPSSERLRYCHYRHIFKGRGKRNVSSFFPYIILVALYKSSHQ